MLSTISLERQQSMLAALETSRQRVLAHIETYNEVPCERTLANWQHSQDVASDMMLLYLKILRLQDEKMEELSYNEVEENDILSSEETCVSM
jgi:hypothetical protein